MVILEQVVREARIAGAALGGEAVPELGLSDGRLDDLTGQAVLAGPVERARAGERAQIAIRRARADRCDRDRAIVRRRGPALDRLDVGEPACEVRAEVPRAREVDRVERVRALAILATLPAEWRPGETFTTAGARANEIRLLLAVGAG